DQHIIPIEECHIIRPELLDLFEQLQVEMRGALEPPPEDAGPTRPLAPDDGEPVPDYAALSQVRLQVGSASDDLLVSLRTINDELPSVQIDLPVQVSFLNEDGDSLPLIGPGLVTYNVMGRTLRVTAGGFFQVNLPQAEALVRLVLEKLALKGGESVLDLYSGVGLFSAFLAREASLVTSVESFGAAVSDAEFNLLDMPNVELIEGTVEDTLAELDGPFDAAVCDPPRTGMEPAALDALARHAPGRLVYVSCDPATFARDAKRLAAHGYRLIEVQPVDMFPQTFHIELVALLER
ncbi:MAG: class I SAM-dependent RNA methyltransferase, partial [Anaerolineae bacterium]|nr:class I SAM-dependent RNA methyltransferase [Anaerolineae bacterium]